MKPRCDGQGRGSVAPASPKLGPSPRSEASYSLNTRARAKCRAWPQWAPPCTCPSSNTNTSLLQGLGQVLGYGPMGPPALPQLLQQSLPTAVTRAKCRGSPLLGLAPTTMPHRRDNYGQRARSHLAQLPLQAPCWESQGRVAPAPVAGSHQALFES